MTSRQLVGVTLMPTYLWDSTLACRARAEASPLAVARPSIGCACSTFKVAQPARRKPVECVSGGGIAQVSANWAARRSRGFASVADRDGYLLTLLLRLEVWRWRSRFASLVMPPRPPASHLPCMCRSERLRWIALRVAAAAVIRTMVA